MLFELDNTLVDFMRMKKLAVEITVEHMINAASPGQKEDPISEIFNIYRRTHIGK